MVLVVDGVQKGFRTGLWLENMEARALKGVQRNNQSTAEMHDSETFRRWLEGWRYGGNPAALRSVGQVKRLEYAMNEVECKSNGRCVRHRGRKKAWHEWCR